jgi:glutaconate CoA-transferase subunit B
VVLLEHKKHRLVERVQHVTSPGHGPDARFRETVGLRGGGPAAVITDRGVLRFDERTKTAYLASVHDPDSIEEIQSETGFDLHVAESCQATPSPTETDLRILRSLDPDRFWLGGASN